MSLKMSLYEALITLRVPPEKARAVTEACREEVQILALKPDLARTENQMRKSISDVAGEMRGSIRGVRSSFEEQTAQLHKLVERQSEQIATLNRLLVNQVDNLKLLVEKQGDELFSAIDRKGNSLHAVMKKQESLTDEKSTLLESSIKDLKSKNRFVYWQLGIVVASVVFPLLKIGFDHILAQYLYPL
ncbi:hypothetical protein [Pseudomonas gingeri]|uniref:hypothetical protein n=1 Tax=Pseudomonas gingeri TaxID=117681 RepID=UPI0015BF63F2|nr:hypothetical protein [Pseudomonas gingeri]NWD48252.1 hypothetical protein [Pseudomonas gingeri]